ncbi:MAG: TonB-dependent siderophore receptor, partial [Hansschlegelia sp.]
TLDGLSLGGGARYTGRSWGDDENTFRNRSFLLFDAVAKVQLERIDPRFKGVTLQVNARNLFDKTVTTCQSSYCYRDEGRQVLASLRYRW